ncbi:nitrilase/cyanide hydratase and apolipoprotein N-acyltransferase [Pontibacillus halophilus JSM 076056 = DSM 19796]|uniref:Nitrilase/cyanide hydratase and apolipoprotein N-acyltransferase n=1 Tax=Pontibacillus halophilus JSM 076056 = DSM 19796 TaxID=1385510 RepID=A0A0A5GLY6_9BACI|nr:carbon-nitrogen family hydrolase [Pontibacillus halophilus]KGX92248.1 nitrilase/cyanide hydratase and apolipoprotein N-acyltransferase [Pontibacillus halophilus JSM 076056 = DSM 19796]
MKYALYQMDIIAGEPEANRQKVRSWVERTVQEEKPDLIVLPEMWTTAYTLPQLKDVADQNGEPTLSFLKELAKEFGIHIIGGSVANQVDERIYNTAIVVNKEGELVHTYNKIHLVPMLNEPAYLDGGEESVQVFELDGIKMGVLICYDLRFPEVSRQLALAGVQVLHVVAEWPSARREHWKTLLQARAIENQMYVVSCNRVGAYDGTEFAGTSMFIDPWGTCHAIGDVQEEETIRGALQLDEVPRIREEVPVFKSRVPNLYK